MWFIPIIIPIAIFATVAVFVVKEVVSSVKKEKERSDAERAKRILDEKDDFQKFLGYESKGSSQTGSAAQSRQSQRYVSPKPQPFAATSERQQRTAQLQADLKSTSQRQDKPTLPSRSAALTGDHHESHCDTSHGSSGKYRVEYVPTMGSGKSTEGCEEHYNTRFVKIDEVAITQTELTPLQKVVVYGEVINQPAFKRRRR